MIFSPRSRLSENNSIQRLLYFATLSYDIMGVRIFIIP